MNPVLVLALPLGAALVVVFLCAVSFALWDHRKARRTFMAMVEPEYALALGPDLAHRRAKHVARRLVSWGKEPDYFAGSFPTTFFHGEDRDWLGAEAFVAVSDLFVDPLRPEVDRWLVAFAGPARDGAPLRTFMPLTAHPRQWRAWVDQVGGHDTAVHVITAGLTPAEATVMAESGTLSYGALMVLAALR